jgi:hypothetical protein
MPKHVIEDAQVTINSVVLSNRVKKVTVLTSIRAPKLATAMTDSWEDRVKVTIRDWRCEFEFYQDYTSGSVFEALNGIANSTSLSGVPIIVRPTTELISTGNPEFRGNVLLDGDIPYINVSDVGDINMAPVKFVGAGTLTVATSSS